MAAPFRTWLIIGRSMSLHRRGSIQLVIQFLIAQRRTDCQKNFKKTITRL